MDSWDEIRTAFHVARMGTVSGAADVLGVHHATVIRHIDALEGRLGAKLFQRHARGNSLFINRGDGTFADVSQSSAVTMGRWAWGSRFADLNNDGQLDIVVANGFLTQPDSGDL